MIIQFLKEKENILLKYGEQSKDFRAAGKSLEQREKKEKSTKHRKILFSRTLYF